MADQKFKTITVRRDGEKDLRFEGVELGWSTSARGDAPNADKVHRWKEYHLYRTKAGNYVCQKTYLTERAGEVDRYEVRIIEKGDQPVWFSYEDDSMSLDRPSEAMIDMAGQQPASAEERVKIYFGRDSLAKELYAAAGIEDVEVIE
jgi:hypothetical protein